MTGIFKKSLYELISSPFGNQDHVRRFLVRVLPSGTDYGPQLEIKTWEGSIRANLYGNTEKSGIRRKKTGLFEFF